MKIGFLGTGTIASAVVHGIARDGHQIYVSERSADKARDLAARYDNVTVVSNEKLVDESDVIFLGLMPDVAATILPSLPFQPQQTIISFIAALSLDRIADLVAPANARALMLPFPNIAYGGSVIPMIGDEAVVASLFGASNTLTVLKDQREMDALLCAQAVLSPASKLVQDAAIWLEDNGVDQDRGEPFLRMLVASNLSQTPTPELLAALNTPGGYNQRLRQHMDQEGVPEILTAGLDVLKSPR